MRTAGVDQCRHTFAPTAHPPRRRLTDATENRRPSAREVETASLRVVDAVAACLRRRGSWRVALVPGLPQRPPAKATAAPARVPVDIATATRADFPVYLNGLGIVQAWNTVTVRTRVDGQIEKVAFKEGQIVKQGDLLLQIDPRPFQAALDQAMAKKAQDQALLANGKRDLERYTTVGTWRSRQQQIDTQRALVAAAGGADQERPGAIDNAQVQLGYTTITRADRRARRLPPGRPGQHRACQRSDRHRRHRAARADRGGLHRARGAAAAHQRGAEGRGRCRSSPTPPTARRSSTKARWRWSTTRSTRRPAPSASRPSSPTRITSCGRRSRSRRACSIETLHDVVVVPDAAVQRGPDGLFAYVVGQDGKARDAQAHGRRHRRWPRRDRARACSRRARRHVRLLPAAAGLAGRDPSQRRARGGERASAAATRVQRAMNISAPFIRYPIAHVADHGGILFVGLIAFPKLPVAPLPQVDFPTIQVSATLPGASPETMASTVAQPLERQFAQIPGVSQMTSTSGLGVDDHHGAVRPRPQHRCRRQRHPGGDQRGRRPAAAEPARAADLSQGQPGRFADPDPVGDLRHAAADRGRRQRRHQARAADQPDRRRRPGRRSAASRSRPSASSSIRPSSMPRGLSLEDVRRRCRSRRSTSPRAASTATTRSFTIYTNDQLTNAGAWNDVIIAYRNGAPMRVRDIGAAVPGPEDTKKAAWATGKRGVFLVVFKQPGRQRHRDRRAHQGRAAAAAGGDAARRSTSTS